MNVVPKNNKRRQNENGFEQWGGYMNAKITKLEAQYEEDALKLDSTEKESNIFEGIAIFVNGYTEPSSDDLRFLMLHHGGTFHHYFRSEKTTHVIASNLPNSKMDQLKTLKVVKPEWIVKSVEAGKLLDYKNFLLYTKQSKLQTELKFNNKEADAIQDNSLGKHPCKLNQNVAKTAVDQEFLTEFYNNSRLHHLSTMGAMFKQYVGELKEKHSGIFPGRERLAKELEVRNQNLISTNNSDKLVMHIDMDCFFVSVALRNHPELKGKPVAVAHARGNRTHHRPGVDGKFEYQYYKKKMAAKLGLASSKSSDSDDDNVDSKPWMNDLDSRSEIASCSYEARESGVHNGMYLGTALRLCPNLKTVPYDFEAYKEVSYTLYNTVAEYTLDIEAVSCDELFIDCGSLARELGVKPLEFAASLRKHIFEKTNCPSSVGIGSNKLQARLATKHAKPNGQFQITDLVTFMSEVDIYDLPGVGRTIGHKLKALNVKTCQDLQNLPLNILKKEFGAKTGETLYKHCRGVDDRTVTSTHERKSVSAEVNYGIRFTSDDEVITFLRQLSGEVSIRLKDINMKGRNITFKVMVRAKDAPMETAKFLGHGACDSTTRSLQLPFASNDNSLISKHVINMYRQMSVSATELRGIGIQITKLESSKKPRGNLTTFLKRKDETGTSETVRGAKVNPNIQTRNDDHMYKLKLPPMSQIDREVLESLPNKLRAEILNEYGVCDLDVPNKSGAPIEPRISSFRMSQINMKVFNDSPKGVKEEIIFSGSSENTLGQQPLEKVRMMMREWIATEDQPRRFDIDLLCNYACGLIFTRRIEDVDILMKGFRRHFCEKRREDDNWIKCYTEVVSRVQSSMRKTFGKDLFIEDI